VACPEKHQDHWGVGSGDLNIKSKGIQLLPGCEPGVRRPTGENRWRKATLLKAGLLVGEKKRKEAFGDSFRVHPK